jgi:PAS domain S-box-containing protein
MGGYTVQEVIGKEFRELISPEDLEIVADRYQRRQRGEDVPREYEFHMMHKDGRNRILVNMNVGLITFRGRLASMGTVKDIREKKLLELQLLRAQRMESIGTLAGGIAHDINNVLTPIMLSQELLRGEISDEERQRYLNIIGRSTQRGASLMKQVMSYARGVEGERTVLQMTHLISEIRQIAKETFPRNIEIRTDIPKDLWNISGDATQLHQVLMNFCVNARDAMPDGGILRILAENLLIDEDYAHINIDAKVGPYIIITVSDTGTGIPPGILDRIFEPFFTTKEHGKGTGLGLSTALGIVKSHGGFITVYTEVGKGTAFKVYLPAITTNETLKAQEHQRELPGGHGELILVVDDEDQIREMTKKTLETHGYRVITANDGKAAIELYTKNRDDIKLVLMDMMMPVMDGSVSIRELRKAYPEVKIIAVSGLTQKDKIAEVEIQVQAFLAKPYTAEKLLNTIHEVSNAN